VVDVPTICFKITCGNNDENNDENNDNNNDKNDENNDNNNDNNNDKFEIFNTTKSNKKYIV